MKMRIGDRISITGSSRYCYVTVGKRLLPLRNVRNGLYACKSGEPLYNGITNNGPQKPLHNGFWTCLIQMWMFGSNKIVSYCIEVWGSTAMHNQFFLRCLAFSALDQRHAID